MHHECASVIQPVDMTINYIQPVDAHSRLIVVCVCKMSGVQGDACRRSVDACRRCVDACRRCVDASACCAWSYATWVCVYNMRCVFILHTHMTPHSRVHVVCNVMHQDAYAYATCTCIDRLYRMLSDMPRDLTTDRIKDMHRHITIPLDASTCIPLSILLRHQSHRAYHYQSCCINLYMTTTLTFEK